MKIRTVLFTAIIVASSFSNVFAQFNNVSASAAPTEGGIVTGEGVYFKGTSVTLKAKPNSSYIFIDWTENGSKISDDSVYTFIVRDNRDLVANFKLKSYLIESTSLPLEGGVVSGSGTYIHGASVELAAIPNTGYSFVNWSKNNFEVSSDSVLKFTALTDENYVANFNLKKYLINAISTPLGSGIIEGAGNYNHGDSVVLKVIAAEGYSFESWSENGVELSSDTLFNFIAETNRNLSANFSRNTYYINASAFPILGGTVGGTGNFNHGVLANLVATPASGYIFSNWTEGNKVVSTDSNYLFTVENDRDLVANFGEKQFTVTTTVSPPLSGITKGDSTYTNLSLVNVIASSNVGWKFSNWSENNNILAVDSNYSFIIFKDKHLTANFTKLIYNLTLTSFPVEAGTVLGQGNFAHDSLVTITATPSKGYHFTSWSENGTTVSIDSFFTFNILTNRNLVANFSKKLFTIQTESNPPSAGITKGDSNYTYGDKVNLIAIADSNAGWEFINWTENGYQLSYDSIYTFSADTNHNITANFQLKNYSVDLIPFPNDAGSVDGLGTYTHGENVNVKAIPQSGWFFANWTDGQNNISDEPNLSFTINEDKVLIANFAHELYSINITVEPSQAGYVSGSGTFYYNQNATLIPSANPGWEFVNWTENETEITSDSLLSFNITKNMSVVANFRMVHYSINCSVNPVEAGYTSGCGISRYNQEMNLVATPNDGWEFVNWTEDGDTVSTMLDFKFSVTQNRNVIANFQLVTSILDQNKDILPSEFYLSNAYPNPFNPSTNINFGLPVSAIVKIVISNINGEIIQTLLDNKSLSAGSYSEQFNAVNLTSGIYFYIISAHAENNENSFRKVGKMILLK